MKTFKVSFTLTLNDEAGHPRKWVPEALWANLNKGEDIDDYVFEEVEPTKDSPVLDEAG